MGTYKGNSSPFLPHELECGAKGYAPRRGTFTKEFMSTAAREGWADFVSAWAWNVKGHADCEIPMGPVDFDLDGDVDNYFGDYRDFVVSCRNHPEWQQADAGDPTGSFIGTQNWLDDVLDEGVCDPFDSTPACVDGGGSACASDAVMESHNRSTVYDWHRMLYALYKDQGLTPKELSDLYINMCPRNWRPDDGTCPDTPSNLVDDLPIRRWVLSADELGHTADVTAELLGVQH